MPSEPISDSGSHPLRLTNLNDRVVLRIQLDDGTHEPYHEILVGKAGRIY